MIPFFLNLIKYIKQTTNVPLAEGEKQRVEVFYNTKLLQAQHKKKT